MTSIFGYFHTPGGDCGTEGSKRVKVLSGVSRRSLNSLNVNSQG